MENDEITKDIDLEQENNDSEMDNSDENIQEVDYKSKAEILASEVAKWKAIAIRKSKKPQTLQDKPEPIDEDIVRSVRELKLIEQKRQFGYDFNLSPEETDFVFKFSGGKPNKETLENAFVKSGLEGFRASKRLENNIPSSKSGSRIFQEKEFSEMTDDERRKAFDEASKKFK